MKDSLEVIIPDDSNSLIKEQDKCIQCGYCMNVCRNEITVARMFDIDKAIKPICVNCGQCANMCPTEAIREKFDYINIKKILKNKDKKVVFSVAPAVRVAIGEEFGLDPGMNMEGKIVSALKKIGADYVFDITFGADLTIMEEAMELVNRINNGGILPMFTSCCPAWVKYAEIFYPELLPNLSSCKSPITMQSSIIKTYFCKVEKIDVNDIVNIVVAPCTAKKAEIKREEINRANKYWNKDIYDTDYVITTRELAMLLKEENVDLAKLDSSKFDSPLGRGSGAGIIFGNSGGVAEAALRTAYYYLTGDNLKKEELEFNSIRGMNGSKECSVKIKEKEIKIAVCNGMASAKDLIDKLLNKDVYYDFVEVMNCNCGCIAGGGQPKITMLNKMTTKRARMDGIYDIDKNDKLRLCHDNPEIKEIYNIFLEKPNSEIAEKLLHTHYEDKSYLLGGKSND